MKSKRQLAAIMFTDMVGYTALMGKDSSKALELVRINRKIQKPLVEKHGGNWLKEMGDGAMAQFNTALDAVHCAVEIQRASRADFEADLRIGIHSGDITIENNDVYGDGVNVAARLESIADPGGIYISESIEKAIHGQSDIKTLYLGALQLKNVNYEVRSYALQGIGLPFPSLLLDKDLNGKRKNGNWLSERHRIAILLISGVLLLAAFLFYRGAVMSASSQVRTIALEIVLPEELHLAVDTDYPAVAVSPDGNTVVLVAVSNGDRYLYSRKLDQPHLTRIDGTKDCYHPFFSTDGSWICFFRGNHVMKVAARGGLPIAVHSVPHMGVHRGATWFKTDSIVLAGSANASLTIGNLAGDQKHAFTEWEEISKQSTNVQSWPVQVRGTSSILFTEIQSAMAEDSDIAMISTQTNQTTRLINGGSFPKLSSDNHILFVRNNSILTASFDEAKGSADLEEEVVNNVFTSTNGSAQFDVGGSTLVYIPGEEVLEQERLVYIDRNGQRELILDQRVFLNPNLSSDDSKIAFTNVEGSNLDVWMLELNRMILERLTFHPGEDFGPVWGPDGQKLVISSEIAEDHGEMGPGIAVLDIASPTSIDRLHLTPQFGYWDFASSWSRDGKWLLFSSTRGEPSRDIEVLNMQNGKDIASVVVTENAEFGGVFSPDGQWIAYVSDISGQNEIYIKPFSKSGDRHRVSKNGGYEPLWSKRGDELFYRNGDGLLSVSVDYQPTISLGSPQLLFEGSFKKIDFGSGNHNYDVTADGSKFVMIERLNIAKPRIIEVILNWQELLGDKQLDQR